MRVDPYYKKNLEQRIIKDADQTEFSAMLRDTVLIDAGLYDDRVSGAFDDFETNDSTITEDWHALDLEYDSASSKVYQEIERRSIILGDAYPFKIKENQITYKESKSYFYEFCLAISSAQNITTGENRHFPRIFERMCALLVKLYLGNDSECIHVGSPRNPEVGKKFIDAMKKVHDITSEWVWSPIQDFGSDPQTTGDEGLDFIAWKNTPDRRKGRIFIIGQCACGDDWDTKFNDLTLGKIGKWFNPLCYVHPPVRAFSTPYHLSDINLMNAQSQAGIVFDRTRLCLIAEGFYESGEMKFWKDKIQKLSKSVIK